MNVMWWDAEMDNSTRSGLTHQGWSLNKLTQFVLFICKIKKFELNLAHNGLVGYTGWLTSLLK